jgi:hypothetical protein
MEAETYTYYDGTLELTLKDTDGYIMFNSKGEIEICANGYGSGYLTVSDEHRYFSLSHEIREKLINFLSSLTDQ